MFPNAYTRLVLGSPGCGKTTELLRIMSEELKTVAPNKIAFVSFTKQAAEEARTRMAAQFKLGKDDLPWVKTIHALCYARLGVGQEGVLGPADWAELSKITGESLTGMYDATTADFSDSPGDQLLRVIEYAEATQQDLFKTAEDLGFFFPQARFVNFINACNAYKRESGKMSFNDMLRIYLKRGEPIPVEVAIIDEAQDLTRQQWLVVKKAFASAARVYVAGDDDQAIYKWAGADVETFLTLPHQEQTVLPRSWRLPPVIWSFGQRIVERIRHRYPKIHSSSDHPGMLGTVVEPGHYLVPESGSVYILARNTYMLTAMKEALTAAGVPYMAHNRPSVKPEHVAAIRAYEKWRKGEVIEKRLEKLLLKFGGRRNMGEFNCAQPWFEALDEIAHEQREYYRMVIRRKELGTAPRVRLDTIHGVKGGEADHVLLLTDMSTKTEDGYWKDADNEHRVFYVGATRARHTLTISYPVTPKSYPLDLQRLT